MIGVLHSYRTGTLPFILCKTRQTNVWQRTPSIEHRDLRLNFDILHHFCNLLSTNVFDALCFSLTCKLQRNLKDAPLQRRLTGMWPIILFH